MNKPKKQHYVPRFLLKNFSAGRKDKEQVWVLDKRLGKIYRSSIWNVGHENSFYEYHGDDGDIELENLMQLVDSKGACIIQSITETAKLPEDPKDRVWLSYFVAAQMLRTPTTRNEIENLPKLIFHKFGELMRGHPDAKTFAEFGSEDAKFCALRLMSEVPKFAKLLQKKVWVVTEAPPSKPYIISDNPVSLCNLINRSGWGNLGLANYGIELYMPVSTRLCLHAICPELAAHIPFTPELSDLYKRALNDGKPIPHTPENAEFVNYLLVSWSERFIYAKKRDHLDLALEMIKTNPDLKNGPSVRQKPEDA